MKSIRLSLLLYFLVLLAGALGAVSLLAYDNTRETLRATEPIRKQLLDAQFKRAKGREQFSFDMALNNEARLVALHARNQATGGRERGPMIHFGAFSTALDPSAALIAPIWWSNRRSGPWSDFLRSALSGPVIQINEEDLHSAEGESQTSAYPGLTYYLQIHNAFGSVWRSRSMGNDVFSLDPAVFTKTSQFEPPKFDEFDLRPGVHIRRVIWKVPPPWVSWGRPPVGPGDRPTSSQRERGTRTGPPGDPRNTGRDVWIPSMVIQCAAETAVRDSRYAGHEAELDQGLLDLANDTNDTLARVRNRMLLVSLLTFGATLVGGFWLVRVGLSPLRRLSDAVSQVSVKDFRLPIDSKQLPNELQPVTHRLTETLDLLKRAFAREKQAAADISHELRTPVASLITTVEVALRKPRAPEEYREALEDCHAAGLQMSQLVERLLTLARLDAGVDLLRPQTVDVAVVAQQCAGLVRPLADARGLGLQVHHTGVTQLRTDPDKLREVLTNLLHNAIEYNQPNGRIDLGVERVNGQVKVEVRDTGIGIPAEAREHIFERFYRADSSRHAEGLHAGLGLAIVKGYVDLMGGTIQVESTEGKGTTFRLELPVGEPASRSVA